MPAISRLSPYRLPAFLLAAVVLVGVGVATILGIQGFSRSVAFVAHSYQVLAALEATETAARTTESNARGYRLTAKPEQLAAYLASVEPATVRADEVVALAVLPQQHRSALELQRRVRARLAEIAALVQLQNEQGAEQARAAMMNGNGVHLMDAITSLVAQMRSAEQVLLHQRSEATDERANLLVGFVVLGIFLPLLMLGLLLMSLARENVRNKRLELEARLAMTELEASAARRDRLSEQRRCLGTYVGLLQSCENMEEAMAMTANVLTELLPQAGGRCYVLRASQNLAESAAQFGDAVIASAELLQPNQCWALRRGQPHRTDRAHGHVRCAHLEGAHCADGLWTLCVPLMAQGTSLGLLHVSARETAETVDGDVFLVESIAEQLSLAMVNLQLRESLRMQSLRDPLTGLFNRRYLEENLSRELMRCERRGLPLSVLMLDVDHFKRFNDQHGHAAGDAMLAQIGHMLDSMTRGEDIACRYGGEEFTVILPETDAAGALRRAEEILAAIGSTTVLHMRNSLGPNTVSIGIATFPANGDNPAHLLQVADAALYRAKAEGRNRAVCA